jgi:hypothetical protein
VSRCTETGASPAKKSRSPLNLLEIRRVSTGSGGNHPERGRAHSFRQPFVRRLPRGRWRDGTATRERQRPDDPSAWSIARSVRGLSRGQGMLAVRGCYTRTRVLAEEGIARSKRLARQLARGSQRVSASPDGGSARVRKGARSSDRAKLGRPSERPRTTGRPRARNSDYSTGPDVTASHASMICLNRRISSRTSRSGSAPNIRASTAANFPMGGS